MKVWLIGAGPGDPGLLTVKGKTALAKADVVVYDALANPSLLALARPEAELIYVGKVAGKHALPQAEINALLAAKAREKGNVARLKGGDPYIFGRGAEEGEYLHGQGIPFEEIPGVSSAIAAPAYAGIPLTHRDLVSAITIITGHEKPGKPESAHNWQAYSQSGATLVFVMGMANLPMIAKNLIAAGMAQDTPAAVIYRGTTPMQRVVTAPLVDLPEAAQKAGLSNPAVIVVGQVAALREKLDWFSQKPLLGKSIVVTRAREQASDIVASFVELGANVLECPSIEIAPMPDYKAADAAIAEIGEYNWLIFTSVNGVKYFWERLALAGLDTRSLAKCKIAAIGPATAFALELRGVRPDLVPESYVAESVSDALQATEGRNLLGMRILLPRAARARNVLPEGLAAAGALVNVVPVYETLPATACAAEVLTYLESGALHCVTFGSSSTVENFLKLIPAEELKKHPEVKLAAIGPVTAATLQKHGLVAHIQPEKFSIPGLVEAVTANLQD